MWDFKDDDDHELPFPFLSLCSENTDLDDDDDTQVQKGYMELEETLQQFKQKSHLMNLLEANKHVKKPEKDFLERFYEGSL